ncbi:MAG: hypothetical protein IJO77_08395 [Oscillospiraceae bacterium]|nr:hypothetical protein [Oscillospiraceae bacterium]
MSRGLDPNFIKAQQEFFRNKHLERAKNTAPDGKRDKKILIGAAVVFAVLAVLLVVFGFMGGELGV